MFAIFMIYLLNFLVPSNAQDKIYLFQKVQVNNCISSTFKVNVQTNSTFLCSSQCISQTNCKGFKLNITNESCELFVYTKTSYKINSVKDNCDNEEFVWVRNDALNKCPQDFSFNFYGSLYRVKTDKNTWQPTKDYCNNIGGFVRLADAIELEELSHLCNVSKTFLINNYYLDGVQPAGSTEPDGGWIWQDANVPIPPNDPMWASSEPSGGSANVVRFYSNGGVLDDVDESNNYYAICECVNPFNL